jgi:hypothetical protein
MARYLIIVARDQTELWRYLTQNIAEYRGVEVLLDRRHEGRWQWLQMRDMQQRGADRRSGSSVDNDLRHRAFVIISRQEEVSLRAAQELPER